jgi:glycosyltransferase involved in cell wall biosynthesis
LSPPHDPEALARGIKKLMEDKQIRQKFGRRGRKRMQEKFDEKKVFELIIAVYKRFLI